MRNRRPIHRWSTPDNLGAPINSAAGESRASFSWDCLRLYFGSTRPGVEGVGDIFVATRPQPGWTESAGRLA